MGRVLPSALVNFTAMLGWKPEGTEEIFSMEELAEVFSFEGSYTRFLSQSRRCRLMGFDLP